MGKKTNLAFWKAGASTFLGEGEQAGLISSLSSKVKHP